MQIAGCERFLRCFCFIFFNYCLNNFNVQNEKSIAGTLLEHCWRWKEQKQ
ncbi:hypothetical protein SLEP1_g28548 [Rubroshorea leprosula]|uniref:Uncharacterized protein n=1 Tax=Rubroshorea leprosula TaxID=152421 RepID=A0AAV5K3H1_9ROSI|nr:hypothetical protein SLEP1_g28548 [Rubroshorea leprosula]